MHEEHGIQKVLYVEDPFPDALPVKVMVAEDRLKLEG